MSANISIFRVSKENTFYTIGFHNSIPRNSTLKICNEDKDTYVIP